MYEQLCNLPGIANYVDKQIVLLSLYETYYGIFDHGVQELDKLKPLALIAMHETEDMSVFNRFKLMSETYARLHINENFGISLIEYLDLPTEYINDLNNVAKELQKTKSSITDNILSGIK